MKIYQITDRGDRVAQNPRLPKEPVYLILAALRARTGCTKEQLEGLTGLDSAEVSVALLKLQSAGLVKGV